MSHLPPVLSSDPPMPPHRSLTVFVQAKEPEIIPETEWQRWFDAWVAEIPPNLSPLEAYEVSLVLTDDATIQSLNHAYRQQDKPTDVLAFAALEDTTSTAPPLLDSEPLYLGDIIISLDIAQQQATRANHSLAQELIWLAAHGFLHLLGWDHPDDESLDKMLARQQEMVATLPAV